MKKVERNSKTKLNLQMEDDLARMVDVLRTKHHINTSSVCREALVNLYNKLEAMEPVIK